MTPDEIRAELQRIKSLPRINDVCRAAGLHRGYVWMMATGRLPVTKSASTRLAMALTQCRESVRTTFLVSSR